MMSRRARQAGGYIMVPALLAVALILFTGVAILSRATSEMRYTRRSQDFERAWYAAMAGIEDCMGYFRYDATGINRIKDPTVGPGTVICNPPTYDVGGASYSATATKIGSTGTQRARIISVGKAGTRQRTLGALVEYSLGPPGIANAWGGGYMKFAGGGALYGTIYTVDTIDVTGDFDVCGNYYASIEAERGRNVDDVPGCNVGFYSNYPYVEFPDFEIPTLKMVSNIDKTVTGNHSPMCGRDDAGNLDPNRAAQLECDGSNDITGDGRFVVYVTGDLTLEEYSIGHGKSKQDFAEQYYTGKVIYVVDGDISVTVRNVSKADGAILTVITDGPNTITLKAGGGKDQALYGTYVAPAGNVTTDGKVYLYGSVYANAWDNKGTLYWYVDPAGGLCTGSECYSATLKVVKLWEQ